MGAVERLIALTKAHRKMMSEHGYPQPNKWLSLVYAFQEAGELADAAITRKAAGQKRNSDREMDAVMELGDLIEMLCTAYIGEDDLDDLGEEEYDKREAWAQAFYYVSVALMSYNNVSIRNAIHYVQIVAKLIGTTPEEALAAAHEKTIRKHAQSKGDVP